MSLISAIEEFLYGPQIFEGLWEATPILVTDLHTGEILAASPPLHRLFGYREGELKGQNVDVLVPSAQRSRHAAHRADYAASKRLRRMGAPGMELKGQRKDGTLFNVGIQLSPKTISGRDMVIGIVVDMSSGGAH